jgi:hypothetical protein
MRTRTSALPALADFIFKPYHYQEVWFLLVPDPGVLDCAISLRPITITTATLSKWIRLLDTSSDFFR